MSGRRGLLVLFSFGVSGLCMGVYVAQAMRGTVPQSFLPFLSALSVSVGVAFFLSSIRNLRNSHLDISENEPTNGESDRILVWLLPGRLSFRFGPIGYSGKAWSRRAQFAVLLIPKSRREDALGDILETAELARQTLGPRAARFFFWKEWLGVMISAHFEGLLKLLSILVPGRRGVGS